jgi:D-galactose 1-dehydrogenase
MSGRTPAPIPIGLVGFGKIARDRHVSAIAESARFVLQSIAEPVAQDTPVRTVPDIESMLAAAEPPRAVSICTPARVRYSIARQALKAGLHVLLEKPPTTTLGELAELEDVARESGATLFCAWHSRFAPAVERARQWLRDHQPRRVHIDWREDVRVWHPGQAWIWEPGGFGVFDPGINALSVAATIVPTRLRVTDALLRYPANCATPIAADLVLSDAHATQITATFDFLHSGPPSWTIEVETDSGLLRLSRGGDALEICGQQIDVGPSAEYLRLYNHFAELIVAGGSDADPEPLRLTADAFLRGRREGAPEFVDPASN